MRKRSKYRPQLDRLVFAPSWGLTPQAITELNARDEAALDAILRDEAQECHLGQLEGSCSSALHAVNYAQANPAKHTLDPACLGPAREALLDCARALLSMREHFKSEGRVDSTEPEREALKDLTAHMATLRAPGALPRRVWSVGTRLAFDGVGIPVPRALADKHLAGVL